MSNFIIYDAIYYYIALGILVFFIASVLFTGYLCHELFIRHTPNTKDKKIAATGATISISILIAIILYHQHYATTTEISDAEYSEINEALSTLKAQSPKRFTPIEVQFKKALSDNKITISEYQDLSRKLKDATTDAMRDHEKNKVIHAIN